MDAPGKNTTDEKKDRRLGDEWADWDGGPHEPEINERPVTFLTLSAAILVMAIILSMAGWYLAKPRVDQLARPLASLIEWSALVISVFLLVLGGIEGIVLLRFGKSLFPYRWIEKFLLALLPKAICLGEKFGISRDRVGNSFIKVHNFSVKSHLEALQPDRVLILLPRCLAKDARNRIISKVNGDSFRVVTAGGGEEARKAIKQHRPSFILALACERDLMSGIRDVAERIPVIAIPNKRPEGPCKNTHAPIEELDEALEFIKNKMNR